MNARLKLITSPNFSAAVCLLIGYAVLLSSLPAALGASPEKEKATTTESQIRQFNTPKEAADALIKVAENFSPAAAAEILGPGSEDIVSSKDPESDKAEALAFAAKAKEKCSIEISKEDPNHAIIVVGNDNFPLPIPLVKQKDKWSFNTKVGREELLNRRIGANEMRAIEVCHGFAEAQHEYAREKHDDSKVNQYAQRIISTPGKHDGLAWPNADGTWGGPIGENVAKALEQGYTDKTQPFHGYYFKILKAQGANAPLGAMNFVVGGAMIGGFALAAAPAEYKVTGVQTFVVGSKGTVYQKDLGPDTLKAFQSMEKYDPDKTWQEIEDDM